MSGDHIRKPLIHFLETGNIQCFSSQHKPVTYPTSEQNKALSELCFPSQSQIGKWFQDLFGLFSFYKHFYLLPSFHLITIQVPSEKILRAGKILRNAILSRAPHMIRDRKYHLKTYRYVC